MAQLLSNLNLIGSQLFWRCQTVWDTELSTRPRIDGIMWRASGSPKGCLSHTVNTKVTKPWEGPASRDFRSPTCACYGARLRMVELKVPAARADLHQPDERNTLWYSVIRFLPVTRYSTTPYSSRQGKRWVGSNYGWSLVVRCRSGFLARVRGPLPRFGHRAWLRGAHGDEASSYRENRSNDPSSMSSVVPRGPRCGLFTVLPICWQIIAGQWT